jgi:hypothetical protein
MALNTGRQPGFGNGAASLCRGAARLVLIAYVELRTHENFGEQCWRHKNGLRD